MKPDSKVAVITGGEGPLGRAVSKKLLSEGTKLAIGWYAENEWKDAQELIAGYSGQYFDTRVDASKEDQVAQFIQKATDTYGDIDILLHMVGFLGERKLLPETDASMFDRLIDVNLKSAFLCSKYVLKPMMARGQGKIIFFPARLAIEPKPYRGAYAVSKSGLITLMLALREELKDTKITVNCVMPAALDTWRTRNLPTAEPEKWVTPESLADLLWNACSNEFSLVSGSILKVFGST